MRSINTPKRRNRLIYDAFDKKKKKKSTVLPFVSEGTLVLENAAKTLNRSGKKKKVLKLIRTSEQPTDY